MTHSLVTIVAMVAFAFWPAQLVELLTLNASYFESHTHKLVWFLVIFTGNIVGAIWFFLWKRRQTGPGACTPQETTTSIRVKGRPR